MLRNQMTILCHDTFGGGSASLVISIQALPERRMQWILIQAGACVYNPTQAGA